jgi:hypothetical protein
VYIDLFNRLEQIDFLISCRSTGNPKNFAKRIGVSERALYDTIILMKSLGAPIGYCKQKKTYFYVENGNLSIKFQKYAERKQMTLLFTENLNKAILLLILILKCLNENWDNYIFLIPS